MIDATAKKMLNRLMEETCTGRLKWAIADAPKVLTQASDNVIPLYFVSVFKGQKLCLFERRSRLGRGASAQWAESLVLGMLSVDGQLVWECAGGDELLRELFADVRRSVADVEAFLKYFR